MQKTFQKAELSIRRQARELTFDLAEGWCCHGGYPRVFRRQVNATARCLGSTERDEDRGWRIEDGGWKMAAALFSILNPPFSLRHGGGAIGSHEDRESRIENGRSAVLFSFLDPPFSLRRVAL